ncbi:HEAT repeat domain-containing protein [Gimesia maris]|uniref:HEAT repeat domain-containing protein n=1 Tax=Gimesia maris TaxID=122 RepID=UPI00241F6AB0|nr:HEAT repeat domain-containing protein [Gimesia maris]|tara:strand:- start:15850 stop:17928 length:2079 start_codon:yes stop_codon:yes gene_type:complete
MRQLLTTVLFLGVSLFTSGIVSAQAPDLAPLIKDLASENEEQQASAAHRLGELGPLSKPAVPALIEVVKAGSVSARSEAIIALGKIGPAASVAVPELAKILRGYSIILKYNTLQALRGIGSASKPAAKQILPLLESNNSYLKIAAARTLWAVDPGNKENLQPIIKVLVDSLHVPINEVRSSAAVALSELGAPAVEPLLEQLKIEYKENHTEQCKQICDVFAHMGAQGEAAIPTLIKALKVENPELVWHAANALGAISAKPDEVVPALTPLLKNSSPEVKAHAAIALGNFGSAAKSAVPELIKLLADSELNVKLDAASALGSIGPDASSAVPALAKAMQDGPTALTLTSASALASIGKAAVPEVTKLLNKDSSLKLLAIHVLGEIGTESEESIPELLKLTKSDDTDIRETAIVSLGEIGPKAIKAEPELIKILENSTGTTRNKAVYALSKIGSKKALPLIKKYAESDSDDERFRLVCAWALLRENPTNPEAVNAALPGLIKALSDENALLRREAASAIALSGPLAKSAIPSLKEALETEQDQQVIFEIITALAEIGPPAAAAIPLIKPYVNSEDMVLRVVATYALARFGKLSESAVPLLEKELKLHNEQENAVTLWALTKIDPSPARAKAAIPALTDLLTKHPNPDARVEAAISLGEFGIKTPEITQALKTAVKDKDPRVQKAAEEALKKLNS